MKIMQIGQLTGDIEIYIKNIVSNCPDNIQFVMVYGKDDKPAVDFYEQHGVTMWPIALKRGQCLCNDLKAFLSVMKLIRHEKPDVIHCHGTKGGFIGRIAGRLSGVKTLYTPHAFSFLKSTRAVSRAYYRLLERSAVTKSYLLACSNSERELGIKKVGYPHDRAYVWANTIERMPLSDEEATTIGDYKNQDYICFMTSPYYRKNPFFVLQVISEVHRRLPKLRFCLPGIDFHSPEIVDLKGGIEYYDLSDCVDLLPWLPREKFQEYIKHAKLYVAVSRDEEGSLAILEAMSHGKVVVASNVMGNRDCMVNAMNGVLLPFNTTLFTNAIAELVMNDPLRARMEQNARRFFDENFTIGKQITKLHEIYRSIG